MLKFLLGYVLVAMCFYIVFDYMDIEKLKNTSNFVWSIFWPIWLVFFIIFFYFDTEDND